MTDFNAVCAGPGLVSVHIQAGPALVTVDLPIELVREFTWQALAAIREAEVWPVERGRYVCESGSG